ncbi:MAG: DeoR/GlpR transcriptional regulator [Clostridia bacterium]|nr:DeoR/GlpR transcriptional regulator [Clostridia bacterium]
MSSKEKRLLYLKNMLQVEKSMRITDISQQLGVSIMTARRDIDMLAQQGIVKILHGGVVYNANDVTNSLSDYMLNVAENLNKDKKKSIGQLAATFVEANDILFIDAGSTTELFANFLPTDFPYTVICYSINIFLAVSSHKNITVVLAGGMYDRTTTILEQSTVSSVLLSNRTKKAFMSAGGVHHKLGVTCARQGECMVKKHALASTMESFLLVDSSKFGNVHPCFFADTTQFNHIITNTDLSDEYRALLETEGIDTRYI